MKLFILVVCTFHLIIAKHQALDHPMHCKSCLTIAQEIVKVIKDSPAVTRQIVLKRLLGGDVCDRPVFHNHNVASKDTMSSSCKQLLEDHHEEFSEVLLSEEPKNLEITMCYELSSSCVGVKHQSFTNSKAFKDSDLEDLIRSNEGNIRISQPMRTNSPSKDEL